MGITPSDLLEWKIRDGVILVYPLPADPVKASPGILSGKGAFQEFLDECNAEREKGQEGKMPPHVLDTSAIMSVLYAEPGAERVLGILEAANHAPDEGEKGVLVPFIAVMEVEYRLRRRLAGAS